MNYEYPHYIAESMYPKGVSRKDLIQMAKSYNIPGYDNQYKSPYRNMKWLYEQIELASKEFKAAPPLSSCSVASVPTPLACVSASVPMPVACTLTPVVLKKNQMNEADREKIMGEYKKHWITEFGVDPALSEMQQLGRQRYIEKKFGGREGLMKEKRKAFEEMMSTKQLEKAVKTMQNHFRNGILCRPCENMTDVQRANVDPLQLIRLEVIKDNISHCLCYDVQVLYEKMKSLYGMRDVDVRTWRDPTYKVLYSANQVKRIKRLWAKTRPGSPARIQFEGQIALYR